MKTKSILPSAKFLACVATPVVAAFGLGWLLTDRAEDIAMIDAKECGRASGCSDGRDKKEIVLTRPGTTNFKGGKSAPPAGSDYTGDPVVDALSAEFAAAQNPRGKLAAADSLAAYGSAVAVEKLLTHAVQEPDRELRREIASALDRLSDREGFVAAVSAIAVTDDRAVLDAVNDAISRMGDTATVQQLVDLYRAPLPVRTHRGAVAGALSSIKDPDAARALSALANTAPEPGLIEAAARGLSKLGGATAAQGIADALANAGASDPQLHSSLLDIIQRIDDPAGLRVLENLELMNP